MIIFIIKLLEFKAIYKTQKRLRNNETNEFDKEIFKEVMTLIYFHRLLHLGEIKARKPDSRVGKPVKTALIPFHPGRF